MLQGVGKYDRRRPHKKLDPTKIWWEKVKNTFYRPSKDLIDYIKVLRLYNKYDPYQGFK